MIKGRIHRGDYSTLSDLAADFNQMFENAKSYNRPDSRIYRDAAKLQKNMQAKCQELMDLESSDSETEEEETETKRGPRKSKAAAAPKTGNILKKRLKLLYRTVLTHKVIYFDVNNITFSFFDQPIQWHRL